MSKEDFQVCVEVCVRKVLLVDWEILSQLNFYWNNFDFLVLVFDYNEENIIKSFFGIDCGDFYFDIDKV